jgi:DNA-binding NtrC family response regulator
MKIALVVEEESEAGSRLQAKLKLLGFTAYIAKTCMIALKLVKIMTFDVILISAPTRNRERRSFAGELKDCSHHSTVILITECSQLYNAAKSCQFSCVTAVLRGPATLSSLWRVIEFERDGFGCHAGWVALNEDRRAKSLPVDPHEP